MQAGSRILLSKKSVGGLIGCGPGPYTLEPPWAPHSSTFFPLPQVPPFLIAPFLLANHLLKTTNLLGFVAQSSTVKIIL